MSQLRSPVITFIGKPNNGKSSVISALTMDDRIEIAREAGTTTQVNRYSYRFRDRVVATFYDTPGFEHPRKLYTLLQSRRLKQVIQLLEGRKEYRKDVAILKAVQQSHFISFVVDSSALPNIHTHGYELGILKGFNRDTFILLNPHQPVNYNREWEQFLRGEGFHYIVEFNPMKGGFPEIQRFLRRLGELFPELQELERWHRLDFQNRLHRSFEAIGKGVADIAQLQYRVPNRQWPRLNPLRWPNGKFPFRSETSNRESEASSRGKEEFLKLLRARDRQLKEELKQIWGYYQTPVLDTTFPIDDAHFTKEIGLSRKSLAIVGGVAAGVGIALLDGGATAITIASAIAAGGAVGAAVKPITHPLSKEVVYQLDRKKGVVVAKSMIIRGLQFLDLLLTHGHSNRREIKVSDRFEEWKYRGDIFSKEEEKELKRIFGQLQQREEVTANIGRLAELIKRKFLPPFPI